MATYKEAVEKSVQYFQGDTLAADVFVKKYALTDAAGDVKEVTPKQMHERLAREFARIEQKYPNPVSEQEIFESLDNFRYIVPQGSPMAAIGNPYQTISAGNCYVVPNIIDSYGGILYTDQQLTHIMKRRGGCGVDISEIRPKGVVVNNSAKSSDGIGIFMERFSNTTREVAQAGRRGALMLSISVHHPDIETFISIKKDKTKVTGANISIRVSDEFMNAVENNTDYEQRWPVEGTPKIRRKESAKAIWDKIIEAAWDSAEPGLLFWDAITRGPADAYSSKGFKTLSTNPCGEIPLSVDACRLLCLNLWGFVKNAFTEKAEFDWKLYHEKVRLGQRLMDDIVDIELELLGKILCKVENDPEPLHIKQVEIDTWKAFIESTKNGRRTGLGITALGDVIAALGMRYGSDASIEFTEKVYRELAVGSYTESVLMAESRGAFPAFEHSLEKDNSFIKRVVGELAPEIQEKYKKFGRRNIANTTTAPTGSVSLMTQTTSGIEPAYLVSSVRRRKINPTDEGARVDFIDELGDKWMEYKVFHPKFRTWMDVTGKEKVEESPYHQSTSNDVDWVASVKLQAVAQKWVCHAISKTCNLPNDTTKEMVAEVYKEAWKAGCKGFTVYRDGSRTGVIVAESSKEEKKEGLVPRDAPKRPDSLECDIFHVKMDKQPFTVVVGLMNGLPYEVFCGHPIKDLEKKYEKGQIVKVSHGKSKPATYNLVVKNGVEEVIEDLNEALANTEYGAFTRSISTSLRHGTPVQYMVEQLQKGDKSSDMHSYEKVIARCLKKYIKDGAKSSGDKVCNNCGAESLIYQEGCLTCTSCGNSKCG